MGSLTSPSRALALCCGTRVRVHVGRGGKSGKSITFFTGDGHERALAGELARVLRESGFEAEGLKKFPMTIKKKTHSSYGAFFRDDIPVPKGPTKITF